MKREQLNATLRVEFDDWENIEKKNIAEESKSSRLSSKNEYFHVKIREELLAVLDEKESAETFSSTQKVNQTIRTQQRSVTSYSRKKQENFNDEKSVSR
jgi:hypothetical protein